MKKHPNILERHRKERMEFAKKMMFNGDFLDKTKLIMDDTDGHTCYWHDLKKEEGILNASLRRG